MTNESADLLSRINICRLGHAKGTQTEEILYQAYNEIERLQRIRDTLHLNLQVARHDSSPEPISPQAPIAKITVRANQMVAVSIYAPGLPPGTYDVFCEPEAVAPYLKKLPHCPSCLCHLGHCQNHPAAVFHPPATCPECASGEPAYALLDAVPALKPCEIVQEPDDYAVQCYCGWLGRVSQLMSLPRFKHGCPVCSAEFKPFALNSTESGAPGREAGDRAGPQVSRQTEKSEASQKIPPREFDIESHQGTYTEKSNASGDAFNPDTIPECRCGVQHYPQCPPVKSSEDDPNKVKCVICGKLWGEHSAQEQADCSAAL